MQENQAKYYNKHTKPLSDLHIGEQIRILKDNKWKPAVITEKCEEPRSFIVKTEDGHKFRRNRKHLRQTAPRETIEISDEDEDKDESEVNREESGDVNEGGEEVNVPTNDVAVQHGEVQTRYGRISRKPGRFRNYVT